MPMPFFVLVEHRGLIGPDDGNTAVWSTTMRVIVCGHSIHCEILRETYSDTVTVKVHRDKLGLPDRLIQPFLIALYWPCTEYMRLADNEEGEAGGDCENLIRRTFYHSDATELIRKLRGPSRSNHTKVGA
jgi:hypothetical protein